MRFFTRRLAPAYDLNLVPTDIKAHVLALTIDEGDGTVSLDLAFSVAAHFGLKGETPRRIAAEVGTAVTSRRRDAKVLGLTAKEIERVRTRRSGGSDR